MLTINSPLPFELAEELAMDYDALVEKKKKWNWNLVKSSTWKLRIRRKIWWKDLL